MAEYRLHCFAQSGNAYKAALALELAGADWEAVFVDFFNGGTKTPDYLDLNEMGEVPVLEHRAKVLSQSAVILDYLSRKLGRYRPEGAELRREVMRWQFWDNHKLTSYIATYRYLLNFVPEAQRNADVIAFFGGRVGSALKVLDRHLTGQDWMVGAELTVADLSCIGYFYYADEWGFDAEKHPAIAAWIARIRALPGWKHPYDLMPGHPLPPRA